MMNEDFTTLSIFVLGFFLQSRSVFHKIAKENIEQRFDLLRRWISVSLKLNLLVA